MDLAREHNLWRHIFASLIVCWLASSDVFAQAPTTDPSLVLHYTFDQDTGQTTQDLSSHGSHGEVVNTQYLEEVNGRRGVLRFNDEKSVINCPDSDSLFFEGDMTFEMWVRLNGSFEPSSGMLFGDRKAPIDLDEFRLYQRALTTAEVAAHAKGENVAPEPSQELFVEPHWYDKTVALRLSCKGANYEEHTGEMTLLRGDQKQAVAPQTVEFEESFGGSARYVATVTFLLSDLEGKSLDGVARILGPDGAEVKTVYRHAFLAKPDWVHTQEGYWDGVPPPWTPVQAQQKPDGAVAVRVWGRRHEFSATPLLKQIETRGKQILAAPMTLTARADGEVIEWNDGRSELKQASDTVAHLEQIFDHDWAELRIETGIEYDGYMLFDCTLHAKQQIHLELLRLQIPLRSEHAKLCYGAWVYPKESWQKWMTAMHSGAVRGDLAFRFSPNIWLGDEQRGLCWQAESDEHWHPADEQKAIEILPRGDATIFQANLVEVPQQLARGEALRFRFALLATPVKPLLRDSWDLRIVRFEPYGRGLELPEMTTHDVPTAQVIGRDRHPPTS